MDLPRKRTLTQLNRKASFEILSSNRSRPEIKCWPLVILVNNILFITFYENSTFYSIAEGSKIIGEICVSKYAEI